jgi:hypothetical protein
MHVCVCAVVRACSEWAYDDSHEFVCVCVYTYVCMYVYTHSLTHPLHIHTPKSDCIHTCTHACMQIPKVASLKLLQILLSKSEYPAYNNFKHTYTYIYACTHAHTDIESFVVLLPQITLFKLAYASSTTRVRAWKRVPTQSSFSHQVTYTHV